MRTEPAVSVPSATSTRPAATAAPLPPLDPPVVCAGFHGFSAGPKCGLFVSAPYANSCVFSLPTIAPPAARSRATQVASRSGTRRRIFDAAVVGMPATSITSLTADGELALVRLEVEERVELVVHGRVSGGSRCSIPSSAGRIRVRKSSTASRSSSVGETPCAAGRLLAAARRG